MPSLRQRPAARGLALLLCALALLGPRSAWSTTFYVDAAAGADLAARDGLSMDTAWRSVTYALTRIRPPGPHEIRVTAGEYSQASGERFPVTLPYDMSLTGSGPDLTVFHDSGTGSGGTISGCAVITARSLPRAWRAFSIFESEGVAVSADWAGAEAASARTGTTPSPQRSPGLGCSGPMPAHRRSGIRRDDGRAGSTR